MVEESRIRSTQFRDRSGPELLQRRTLIRPGREVRQFIGVGSEVVQFFRRIDVRGKIPDVFFLTVVQRDVPRDVVMDRVTRFVTQYLGDIRAVFMADVLIKRRVIPFGIVGVAQQRRNVSAMH